MAGSKKAKIRRSAVAGLFYPEEPHTLSSIIERYLQSVSSEDIKGEIIGVISPHAGYIYSGGVAAHAYKLIKDRSYDIVVVIAPSHRVHFNGVSIYNQGGYETPLGIVPVDIVLANTLITKSRIISYVVEAHREEHSLEVQLPFLQKVLKDFMLIPLVMGEQSYEVCEELSKVLVDILADKKALFVASSDLSHYYSYKRAFKLDKIIVNRIKAFDYKGLSKDLEVGTCEACGGGPIVVVMDVAKKLGADTSVVLKYANSGDTSGDMDRVVGYLSAAFINSKAKPARKGGIDLGLTKTEKKILHHIAREAIDCELEGRKFSEVPIKSEALKEKRGAFVSLHKYGSLKGCIGNVTASEPLYETVKKMAKAAAFEDIRFEPLKKDEFKDLDIEISILTPLEKIDDPEKVEVGKHGIYIKKGFSSGLLLPQVAVEYNWNRKTFLEHTCLKAGLPKEAWKDKGIEIYVFSADVF
ncbi:MAG: AmmeMemoRadiSam system protein B [Thermodesulfobacteriota bacterium]|nr:AmmeMemoRadiSam system protein B [Thermodesulfobacteriota bacterium]